MKILLTGANGYIGRRLLPVLILEGYEVICLVRDKRRLKIEKNIRDKVEFFEADLLREETLKDLPKDIEGTYYLVHSMGRSSGKFEEMEKAAALNFKNAIENTRCKHVIYLSGIANDEQLSKHLSSRKNVENILLQSKVPVTVLRAAIIIGSGGASFEIIRDLVEKLPVMIAPRWLNTRCQPIAIRNVISYMQKILFNEKAHNKIFDIGGPDILTYKEMLYQFAKIRGFRRYIITIPFLTPKLSSYWLYFVTSTSFNLAKTLVDSMKNEVIVENHDIQKIVPMELLTYEEAVQKAFDKIAQNEVISSWKDAFASSDIDTNMMAYVQIPQYGCLTDKKVKKIKGDPERVIENIWQIGGTKGWYSSKILWEIRGFIDNLVGGVGLRRGRRSPIDLIPGDALDFWRVILADKKEKRLILYAEMKLPGEAWLEFNISENDNENVLVQTATFRPSGLWGRMYWYSLLPFHAIIFDKMAENIANS